MSPKNGVENISNYENLKRTITLEMINRGQ